MAMQASTQTNPTLGGLPYKWLVAIAVIFGLFMVILDTTIVNIAIPRLQSAFGAPLDSVQWVATGYTLAEGVATPLTPFLSELLGLKRFYLGALALFTLGSALCGLAWSLPVLIAFRLLQGAFGASLIPMSFTLLYREFPPQERGAAVGVLGIPILLAPALGPTIGGYIVTSVGWPLVFYLNLPIGIVGIIMGSILLREFRPDANTRFDLLGFVFSAAGLVRGQTAFEAGMILLPQALASMVAVVVGGQLVDRIGVKPVVIPGLFFLAFALWRFSFVSLQTPFLQLQLLLILRGFGIGLAIQPLSLALLSDIKSQDLSQANTINSVIRAVASSMGVAVLAPLVQTQTSIHYAHLAELVTATSPTGQLILQLEASFTASATSPQAATAAAIQLLIQQLQQQANMLAIDDAFLFTLLITIAAIVLVLLIPIRPQPKGTAKPVAME